MKFPHLSYLTEDEYNNILELEQSSETDLFERILKIYKTYGPPKNQEILQEAFTFGKHIHRFQRRESGAPYFTHPLIVALMMMEYAPSSDLIIATMLHDAIEDSEEEGTDKEVLSRFGESVYTMIDGVSKVESVEHSKERKNKETLKKLFSCAEKESRILVIKIFDRLHNIMTLSGKKDPKKRKKKAEETMNVYLPASETLGLWEVKKRLENACIAHLFPEKTKEIELLRKQALEMHQNTLEKFEASLVDTPYKAESRWYSTMNLIHRYGSSHIPLEHLFFLRVIVPTEDECYTASSAVNKHFPQKKDSLRNYITSPKTNGYRSVHTVNIVDDSYSVHVHIVSESMKERNDAGVFTSIHKGEYALPAMAGIYLENMSLDAFQYVSVLTGDILTKKITIYHPEKGRLSFPKKSLVLDTAIALFPEKWQYLRSGQINRTPVSLFHPLKEDDIVSFDFADTPQIEQRWVSLVKTVQAKFQIQNILKTHDPKIQREEGKSLIQALWDQEKRGSVYDAFMHDSSLIKQLEVESIEQLFERIYQGVIMPEDVLFLVRKKESEKVSCWKKIRSWLPWKPKNEGYQLNLSVQSSLLSGGESEEIIKKQCAHEDIQLKKFSLTTTESGSKGKIFLHSEEYRPLLNVFHSLQTDPRIQAHILPPSLFLWKILLFFLIPMGISVGMFIALFTVSSHEYTPLLYGSVFFMALANAFGYSTISQYFSWLRHSIPFLIAFICTNVAVSGSYVYCFVQKGYDIYQLDFYFPLIVLLLSMAFPIFFFKRDKVKEPDLPNISMDEYQKKQQEKRMGYFFRFMAVIIWGLQPLYIKYSPAGDVAPDIRTFFTGLGGALASFLILLSLLIFQQKQYWKPKIKINHLFVFIVVGQILYLYLMNVSLNLTAGTHFILLNNFAPIFALLVAVILWKSQIPYLQEKKNILIIFLIFMLGGIGSSFLFYNNLSEGASGSISGDFWAIIAMVADVFLVVSQIRYAKFLKKHQSIFLNLYVSLGVLIITAPILLIEQEVLGSLSIMHLLFALGAGVLSGVGQICNYEAFRRMDGFIAFLMFNISIFITFVVEAFILKEIPATLLLVLGGSLIIGASIFAEVINTRCEKKQIQKEKAESNPEK